MVKLSNIIGCAPSTIVSQLPPKNVWPYTSDTVRAPSNSVGVAFSQPSVEVRSASTLGMHTKRNATL